MLWITSLLREGWAPLWARPSSRVCLQLSKSAAVSPTSAPLYAASRIHHWSALETRRARSAAADATTKAAKTAAAAAEQVSAPDPHLPERRLPSRHDERRGTTTHTQNRSEERFSPTRRSRIRGTTRGEINLLLNLERSHTN